MGHKTQQESQTEQGAGYSAATSERLICNQTKSYIKSTLRGEREAYDHILRPVTLQGMMADAQCGVLIYADLI